MPLHVEVRINRELIETLHIGRIEGGTAPDDINTYIACLGPEPLGLDQWRSVGIEYRHRYGDGALVCVRKALDALEIQENVDIDFQENLKSDLPDYHCPDCDDL